MKPFTGGQGALSSQGAQGVSAWVPGHTDLHGVTGSSGMLFWEGTKGRYLCEFLL